MLTGNTSWKRKFWRCKFIRARRKDCHFSSTSWLHSRRVSGDKQSRRDYWIRQKRRKKLDNSVFRRYSSLIAVNVELIYFSFWRRESRLQTGLLETAKHFRKRIIIVDFKQRRSFKYAPREVRRRPRQETFNQGRQAAERRSKKTEDGLWR